MAETKTPDVKKLELIARRKTIDQLTESDRSQVEWLFGPALARVLQDEGSVDFLQKIWIDEPREEAVRMLRAYEDAIIKIYALGAANNHKNRWEVGIQKIAGKMIDITLEKFETVIVNPSGWREGVWHRTLMLARAYPLGNFPANEETFIDFDGKLRTARLTKDKSAIEIVGDN